MKRHISFTLTLAACLLLIFLLPARADAESALSETFQIPFQTNPLYAELDLPITASMESPVLYGSDASAQNQDPVYLTEAEAAVKLRDYMKNRTEHFTLYVKTGRQNYEKSITAIIEQALVHTGNPKEGDYLMLNWAGWGGQVAQGHVDNLFAYRFDLVFAYYTTAAQEATLDNTVASVLRNLNVSGKSDYEKVTAVYEYLRANVKYDELHAPDDAYTLKHTAYAALVNKTAVADGYCAAMYRLLLELGVDNRVIVGETSTAPHCWNIVKLGKVWYNTDITFDAVQREYSFFLRNRENFPDHYRYFDYDSYEFHTDYPMSATDYTPGVEGDPEYVYVWGVCGDDAYWCIDRDRNLTIFGTGPTYEFAQEESEYAEVAPWSYWAEGFRNVYVEEGITRLGTNAFYHLSNVKQVTLPDSLKEIGCNAFDACQGMTKITFGKGLELINDNAFQDCKALTTLNFPDSLTHIGYMAFPRCMSLKEVSFGNSLISIGDHAFASTAVTAVTFPESLTYIGMMAFQDCHGLKEVTIPKNVADLSGFYNCDGLKTVYLENDNVGAYAFYGCDQLSTVVFSEKMQTIKASAFQYCTALEEITIPESVTKLEPAFGGCTGLKKVTLNNSGTLSGYAFSGCTRLQEVIVGPKIDLIDHCVFQDCHALTRLVFLGDAPVFYDSAFSQSIVTAYYPPDNATWTKDVMQDYGGRVTWLPNHTHELVEGTPVFDPDTRTHKRDCLTCETGLVEDCSFTSAVTRQPSATQLGILTYSCTVCGGSYEETFLYRLYGDNRYETGFAVADALKEQLGVDKFDTIIVASGAGFADALTGSYLASVKHAPILLVNQHFIDEVANYIDFNLSNRGTVYLLGGELAVPAAMEAALDGHSVIRLAGQNRYETNLAILEEAGPSDEEILICHGSGFADSLSASAVGKPILMVNRALTDAQTAYLQASSGKFVIIGGESAISPALEAQLQEYGDTERIGGANRYQTSVMVAQRFFDDPACAVLAYGAKFPDGLCGGPLAFSVKAPLILTRDQNADTAAAYTAETRITAGAVLGGPSLISDTAAEKILCG